MGLNHSPRIVTNGLVLCLDAANKKSYPGSGTAWNDLSRFGNNATLVNGVAFNSEGYLTFDGVNDYATISYSSSLDFPSALTISIWYFSGSVLGSLYLKGRTDIDHYNPYVATNGQYAWVGANGRATYVPAAGYIQSNTWYNLSISHSSGSVPNIFRNGVLTANHTFSEGNGTYALGTNVNPVGINADIPRGTIDTFNGRIAMIQAYNRALTQIEVEQNFQSMRGRFGI